jgi:hypothetical protein
MLRAVPKFSTLAAAGSGVKGASEAKRADALAKMNTVIGDNGKTMTSPQGQITDPKRGLAYFAHNRLFSKSGDNNEYRPARSKRAEVRFDYPVVIFNAEPIGRLQKDI